LEKDAKKKSDIALKLPQAIEEVEFLSLYRSRSYIAQKGIKKGGKELANRWPPSNGKA